MSVGFAIVQAFWFFLPAYVANPLAVLFGGGRPIDGGRVLSDGYRLFGDGKTWRGLAGGVAGGAVVGGIQWVLATVAGAPDLSWGVGPQAVLPVLALPTGALLGDLLGAYIKRRAGKPRGAKAPGLDWYDFYLGAFAFLLLVDPGFFLRHYVLDDGIYGFAFVTVITPVLHRAVNVLGFRLGKKDVPW